ncbi:hypothetical protein BGZ83_006590 [Gryganskiella cystojenkinii]|nr:hypothetical protein BGZ83_006590 [Gryganskiella cystojenkinii]
MTSPSTWSSMALRHSSRRPRPLSLPAGRTLFGASSSPITSPTASTTSNFPATTVRWASIVPFAVTQNSCYAPPPPPMTPEQAQASQVAKKLTLLEEQIQLEQTQRVRQQAELQLQLSRHRNAILEQQSKQQQLYEQDLQERRRRQEQKQLQEKQDQVKKMQALSRQDEQEEHSEAESRNHSEEQQLPKFVATRHRSMFGYSGPEHKLEEQAALELESSSRPASLSPSTSPLSLLSAENRVQLAMMDYTPKQIDAMSPNLAQSILNTVLVASTTTATLRIQEESSSVAKPAEDELSSSSMSLSSSDNSSQQDLIASDVRFGLTGSREHKSEESVATNLQQTSSSSVASPAVAYAFKS